MVVTLAINLVVIRYESREAQAARQRSAARRRAADARRRLDVAHRDRWRSPARGPGLPDPRSARGARRRGFIGHAGYQIATATTRILSDRIVISEPDLERWCMGVPGVIGCHHIRTRGSADHVFLDLHVWLPPRHAAHRRPRPVARREGSADGALSADRDAIIHIEPPPTRAGKAGEGGQGRPDD